MVVVQARNATLRDLRESFNLERVDDPQFFLEWQTDLSDITVEERQQLDRVKSNFSNLLEYPPLLENTVKMVVLSRLLDLANFFLNPFHIKSEPSVRVESKDEEGITITGEIDVLVSLDRLWIVVIEAKKVDFSLEIAKPQLLSYMLAAPNLKRPLYGLITNGVNFQFVKLTQNQNFQYGMSDVFNLFSPHQNLYQVLRILKRLGQLALED
jgi:hypothetical protein